MDELIAYITEKAIAYWNETCDEEEKIESFPSSVVDFVMEYAISQCHFPSHFTDDNVVADLKRCRTVLAMACVDVYARAGAEGEKSHSENGISRTYSDAWISQKLLDSLPNYVAIFS